MKFYKDFKVNEGAFVLKEILEVMYVSESISLPPYIYRKVINLQKALCDYLEGATLILIWMIIIFLENAITQLIHIQRK